MPFQNTWFLKTRKVGLLSVVYFDEVSVLVIGIIIVVQILLQLLVKIKLSPRSILILKEPSEEAFQLFLYRALFSVIWLFKILILIWLSTGASLWRLRRLFLSSWTRDALEELLKRWFTSLHLFFWAWILLSRSLRLQANSIHASVTCIRISCTSQRIVFFIYRDTCHVGLNNTSRSWIIILRKFVKTVSRVFYFTFHALSLRGIYLFIIRQISCSELGLVVLPRIINI